MRESIGKEEIDKSKLLQIAHNRIEGAIEDATEKIDHADGEVWDAYYRGVQQGLMNACRLVEIVLLEWENGKR